MSQNALALPLVGVYSGTTAATDINNAIDTVVTLNSGASAPSGPALGWFWLDTSVANQATLKVYDGSNWLPIGTLDETTHRWTPVVGGGVATVPSAGTTDLDDATNNKLHAAAVTISGVATITSFGSTMAVGALKFLTFSGACVLTHNAASLILPSAANITTAAGDTAIVQCISSGNYRVVAYNLATGGPLVTSGNVTTSFQLSGVLTPAQITATQNDYAPTGNATNTTWRLTSDISRPITGIAGGTQGRILKLINSNALGSTFNITLAAQNTGSSAVNRILSATDIVLRPGQEITLTYNTTDNRWLPESMISAPGCWGSFKNLKITTSITSQAAVITADELILEDADGNPYRLTSVNQTVNLGNSGAGGLDTGSPAINTWYSAWIIYNALTQTTSSLLSTSATAPTLPSGYTFKMRVGWVRSDSSGSKFLLQTLQVGRRAHYVVTAGSNTTAFPSIVTGNTAGGAFVAQAIGNFVPSTASAIWALVDTQGNGAGANQYAAIAPNSGFGLLTAAPRPPFQFYNTTSVGIYSSVTTQLVLESTNIYLAANNTNFTNLQAEGWEDNI